jgi:hypothetical protein
MLALWVTSFALANAVAGAFLLRTRFDAVDLSAVTGLTQSQLDQACGDAATVLPAGLNAPAHWPCPAE